MKEDKPTNYQNITFCQIIAKYKQKNMDQQPNIELEAFGNNQNQIQINVAQEIAPFKDLDPEKIKMINRLLRDPNAIAVVEKYFRKDECLPLGCTIFVLVLFGIIGIALCIGLGIGFRFLFVTNLGIYFGVSFIFELLNCFCIEKIWKKEPESSRKLISLSFSLVISPILIGLAFGKYYISNDEYDIFLFNFFSTLGTTILGYLLSWTIVPYAKNLLDRWIKRSIEK